jgi:hypothetical protein
VFPCQTIAALSIQLPLSHNGVDRASTAPRSSTPSTAAGRAVDILTIPAAGDLERVV